MTDWAISIDQAKLGIFSQQKHEFVQIDGFMSNPETARNCAVLQKFAKITPQYPGLRAPLESEIAIAWLEQLSPLLDKAFGEARNGWAMRAWYSIVTTPAEELLPIQRLPHVDGTDPNIVAMMLYLDHTDHGGTAFFRHKSTGLESLTAETFPSYRAALEDDVRKHGLPEPVYATDGEPYFERIHASDGAFNQAVLYRGNILHCGVIDNNLPLPNDPLTGRLTINAMFRPA